MRSIYNVFVYLQWTTWYVIPSSSEIWVWSVESFEIKVTFRFSNNIVTDSATPELISRFYAFPDIHKTPTWATARCIIFLTIINCRTNMNSLKNINLNDLHNKDFIIDCLRHNIHTFGSILPAELRSRLPKTSIFLCWNISSGVIWKEARFDDPLE